MHYLNFFLSSFITYILYIKISKLSAASIAYRGSNPYAVFKPKWCITARSYHSADSHVDLGRQVCPQWCKMQLVSSTQQLITPCECAERAYSASMGGKRRKKKGASASWRGVFDWRLAFGASTSCLCRVFTCRFVFVWLSGTSHIHVDV